MYLKNTKRKGKTEKENILEQNSSPTPTRPAYLSLSHTRPAAQHGPPRRPSFPVLWRATPSPAVSVADPRRRRHGEHASPSPLSSHSPQARSLSLVSFPNRRRGAVVAERRRHDGAAVTRRSGATSCRTISHAERRRHDGHY